MRRIRAPWMNLILIGTQIIIFAWLQSGLVYDERLGLALAVVFGVIPVEVTTTQQVIPDTAVIPESLTLVTYMFLHGGWLHLGGNMLFLWTFGDNIEDAVGHWRYPIFYVLCGISGGLVHVLLAPTSTRPLIGASGAVAGLVAAYLILHPRVRLWCLVAGRVPLRIDARFALTGWIVTQLFFAVTLPNHEIAWWAHVGGTIAGAVLIVFMRQPGVALFDKGLFASQQAMR